MPVNKGAKESNPNPSGGAVNKFGNEVVDPTKNVLDLVNAAVKRIDDIANIRYEHQKEVADLRASYDDKLRDAEAKRIDAIRLIDTGAVTTANEKANAQATVLANQVSTSAEALRALVTTNATTLATQLTQIITPITDRLALLEKAQYEGAGKERATDPQLLLLLTEVKNLRDLQQNNTGRGQGMNSLWAIIIAGIGVISGIFGIISLLSR
jgi:hypothetical protein